MVKRERHPSKPEKVEYSGTQLLAVDPEHLAGISMYNSLGLRSDKRRYTLSRYSFVTTFLFTNSDKHPNPAFAMVSILYIAHSSSISLGTSKLLVLFKVL